jgi:hypothetical protein
MEASTGSINHAAAHAGAGGGGAVACTAFGAPASILLHKHKNAVTACRRTRRGRRMGGGGRRSTWSRIRRRNRKCDQGRFSRL